MIKKLIFILISAVFWTALWDFAAYTVGMKYVFPSPAVTFKRLFEIMGEGEFYLYAGNSLLNILKGFIGGALIGTVLGALSAFLKGVDILFSPLNTVIKATPVASFIILVYYSMDKAEIPILISMLMIAPIVWSALKNALQNVDRELIEMANTYKMPFLKRITALYLPSVLPSYLTALVTAMALGWKASVAAEILCGASDTLGNGILTARDSLEVVDVFAYTVSIVILSVIMELGFRAIIKVISRKERRNGTA